MLGIRAQIQGVKDIWGNNKSTWKTICTVISWQDILKEESLAYGIVLSKINPNNTKNKEEKLIFNSLGNGHRPNHRNFDKYKEIWTK